MNPHKTPTVDDILQELRERLEREAENVRESTEEGDLNSFGIGYDMGAVAALRGMIEFITGEG